MTAAWKCFGSRPFGLDLKSTALCSRRRPPRWTQTGWTEDFSPEARLVPSHNPISSNTHSTAINKPEACPLRSARALQSSGRHRDFCLIKYHSTTVEVKANFTNCPVGHWKGVWAAWTLYKAVQVRYPTVFRSIGQPKNESASEQDDLYQPQDCCSVTWPRSRGRPQTRISVT